MPQEMFVLILRSAHAEEVRRIRTRVRASRRMRTSYCMRPHASRRIAASQSAEHACPLCAAMLLSMRARVRGIWPNEPNRVLAELNAVVPALASLGRGRLFDRVRTNLQLCEMTAIVSALLSTMNFATAMLHKPT